MLPDWERRWRELFAKGDPGIDHWIAEERAAEDADRERKAAEGAERRRAAHALRMREYRTRRRARPATP